MLNSVQVYIQVLKPILGFKEVGAKMNKYWISNVCYFIDEVSKVGLFMWFVSTLSLPFVLKDMFAIHFH